MLPCTFSNGTLSYKPGWQEQIRPKECIIAWHHSAMRQREAARLSARR
jgi:hypothetical protein